MSEGATNLWRRNLAIVAILAAGGILRLAILAFTGETQAMVADERHYLELARNLSTGRGFGFGDAESFRPTSIRPPLYPFFISGIWTLTGSESLQAVRAFQVLLSLATVYLVYRLGLLAFHRRAALIGAGLLCFYPTYVAYSYLLLTEVTYTFLLVLFAFLFVRLARGGGAGTALATGCVVGLSALARGISWPLAVLLPPLTFAGIHGSLRWRAGAAVLMLLGALVPIAPWAVRNTRLQGVPTVVETMGGMNLYMGNYEHTPLNRAWDAVSLQGEKSWGHFLKAEHPEASGWTEGQKDAWAKRAAVDFMLAHPGLTLCRAAVKLANLWGLEREVIAGWQQGLYSPPPWFSLSGAVLITVSYVAIVLTSVLGIFFTPPESRAFHLLFLTLVFLFSLIHGVVFGHSRYHVPLVPFLCLYAAAALAGTAWNRVRRSGWAKPALALTVELLLLAAWTREVFFVETGRIQAFLELFH